MHCEVGQYISKYLASLFTVSIYIQINWPDFFNVQTKKKQKTHSDPCRIAHVSPITARYTVLAAGCGGKGRGGVNVLAQVQSWQVLREKTRCGTTDVILHGRNPCSQTVTPLLLLPLACGLISDVRQSKVHV